MKKGVAGKRCLFCAQSGNSADFAKALFNDSLGQFTVSMGTAYVF